MQKIIAIVLLMIAGSILYAQNTDDWLWGEEEEEKPAQEISDPEFIKVNYEKKDARLAMIYSMLLPGAGQFYADKSSFTTYVFPVLEVGIIAGMITYNNRGKDKAKDYEHYANGEDIAYTLGDGQVIMTKRYDRNRQHRVESILMGLNASDIYESSYFRLDDDNTQHFYEDIGKYPHYVFGWADWYYHFATDQAGVDLDPIWYPGGHEDNPGWVWHGNYPLWNDDSMGYSVDIPVENYNHASSPMRKEYVKMRDKAKAEYAVARNLSFALAGNHLLAGLDAIRLARKANKNFLSDTGIRFQYYAQLRDNVLTPTLGLNWKF
ncbi:MAG TPA: hypothetical protein PLX77_01025 [Candidatus Cloacimonadota bacterium]|nr:hypothetical protein [Candidatus Cloacimonadota bacterium]